MKSASRRGTADRKGERMKEKTERILISYEMKENLKRALPHTACLNYAELARVAIAKYLWELGQAKEIKYIPYKMSTGRG